MGLLYLDASSVLYATLSLIALLTVPSVVRITRRSRSKPANVGLYEDRDGIATEDSVASYSTRRSYTIAVTATILGQVSTLALAVFAFVQFVTHIMDPDGMFTESGAFRLWMLAGAWTMLVVQVICGVRDVSPVPKFNHSSISAISCFLTLVLAGTVLAMNESSRSGFIVLFTGTLIQAVLACAAIFGLASIDRRPDVFFHGKVVERENQTSLLSWITFSWSSGLLDLSASKLIEITDLPALPAYIRSAEMIKAFTAMSLKPTIPLWILIAWSFRLELLTQCILVTLGTFLDIAPPYMVMRILQYLEARGSSDMIDPQAWFLVIALLASTVSVGLVNSRIAWLMHSRLSVPIRSVLTALIFEKMMRIKDCKEPSKPEDEPKLKVNDSNGNTVPKATIPTKDGEAPQKTRSEITTMFAVDTNTLGVFGANFQSYPYFVFKILVSIAFLWHLVGWKSLSTGTIALVITMPLNSLTAQSYKKHQKALMAARDSKTRVVTEVLQGIRQIKFSATEEQWSDKIFAVREEELRKLWNTLMDSLFMMLGVNIGPMMLISLSLATYAYIHGELLPSVAFTAVGMFLQLEGVLSMAPFLMMAMINAKVSCDRIGSFLQSDEKPENQHLGDSISFENASFSFPSESTMPEEERFTISNANIRFPRNCLSVVSGSTGSGKSLLLAATLGEIDLISGSIQVPRPPPFEQRHDSKATPANWIIPNAIAFVSQTPWIENASIKDNILFGLPYDQERYEDVLQACALKKDLEIFDDGDLTEVGAQGISLSGGQKWRLTLSRALYSRAGILLFDDIFSAVDAHVGKQIYDNALTGDLAKDRTRILVTHHVSLSLPRAQYAVALSAEGTIRYAGLVEELRESGELEELLKEEENSDTHHSQPSKDAPATTSEAEGNGSTTQPTSKLAAPKLTPKKLVEDEKRESGSVSSSVYLKYLKATGGLLFWTVVLSFYILAQGLTLCRSWWIAIWTSSHRQPQDVRPQLAHAYSGHAQFFSSSLNSTTPRFADRSVGFYLGIYLAISMSSLTVFVACFYIVYTGSLRASKNAFKDMTNRVLHTPLRWLDTEPTGRILNRFTADFQMVDSQLASDIASSGQSLVRTLGIMVAAFFVSSYMIILAVVLFGICSWIARRYLHGARGFKRLQSNQRSPVISHFHSALQGLSTIRAFGKSEEFISRTHHLIDSYAVATWHHVMFNCWIGFRMAILGSIFSTTVAAFVVAMPKVNPSIAGFALAFSLEYKSVIIQSIRQLANVELNMNAAERVFEYTTLEMEDEAGTDNLRASWPEEGKIEVEDLEVGYAEGLPSILKGLSFSVRANERIGVVGRTGAGKSTLSLALFRFLKARKGSIYIDGIDISTIKLHDLRTRLSIIPQDPVLFSGTIRSNLDPFDQFSDVQLQEALKRVHLIPSANNTPVPEAETSPVATVTESSSATAVSASISDSTPDAPPKENTNIFLTLSSPISPSGSNLSQGQRQLLCLARAMLTRPKLLLLDEATSAVDMATDRLIQRSIREEFANTTLLVIAHRLSTVVDLDRILVMSDGKAVEFDEPRVLRGVEGGVFKEMMESSGEKEELERKILGS